jgi:hypothetical protein
VIAKVILAFCLVAATVIVHGAGLALVLGAVLRSRAHQRPAFLPITWLIIRVACWLVVEHSVEVAIWALFFRLQGCFPDFESAFYFSGVTYATLGYGDLVLPGPWRLFGPVEGLVGILMCGLSTGFFFAIVAKLYGVRFDSSRLQQRGAGPS